MGDALEASERAATAHDAEVAEPETEAERRRRRRGRRGGRWRGRREDAAEQVRPRVAGETVENVVCRQETARN